MPEDGCGAVPAPDGVSEEEGVPVRLDEMALDHCGTVVEVQAATGELEQLTVLGVCEGRRVMLVRRGDPMILKVLGARIGVSRRLARRVWVTACPAGVADAS
ncbi:MAG: ferrous iron transport protein A [Acidobacteriota bacterium]|nr:MAG: ferrous iron transport protein A [Acidobacteriota bacterium]